MCPIRTNAVAHAAPLLALLLTLAPDARAQQQTPTFDLRDGDRVAFIGGTFFEREYRFGIIETALTLAHPDKRITFRNLGWSGDTVWAEARAYFEDAAHGYENLLETADLVRPTVILLAYGANESFAGPQRLPAFIEQYNKLLDDLKEHTDRIVLLTPPPIDAATSPANESTVARQNADRQRYAKAIRSVAQQRGFAVIDPTPPLTAQAPADGEPLFRNGIHLTEAGYVRVAALIAAHSNPSDRSPFFSPAPPHAPLHAEQLAAALRNQNDLRSAILAKNELFFHRWRPANVTYLFLFRKHEQGNNAAEIPKFDPLIEQEERNIADLRAKLDSASRTPANDR